MIKIVVNSCFGGFSLSNKAVERLIELGMVVTEYAEYRGYKNENADFVIETKPFFKNKYSQIFKEGIAFRTDPRVIQVVEELGKEANGTFADLKVVEIPEEDVCIENLEIEEYDGLEHISEVHRTWS